jgi:purine-binding chemotaxis protein CheW
LCFSASGAALALPAGEVGEILRPLSVSRVPLSAPCLLGVANLRGQVLPVVSAARLLGLDDVPRTASSRVVVDRARRTGLLVLPRCCRRWPRRRGRRVRPRR